MLSRNESSTKHLTDNPGRPGKDWARLVGSIPLKPMTRVAAEEAGFTGSSDGVRALLDNANGTRATKSDEKPLSVE
jgi:hypothetical protein